MFTRLALACGLLAVAFSSEARGQIPTISALGYTGYARVGPLYPHCQHSRSTLPQYQYLAARAAASQQQHAAFRKKRQDQTANFTQEREQEAERRKEVRAALPKPQLSDEQQAEAKFQAARLLWQGGNVAASRKRLEEIEASYPNTSAAVRAADVLAKL